MAKPEKERKPEKKRKTRKHPKTNKEFFEVIAHIPERGIEGKNVKDKLTDFIKDANRSSMEDLKCLEADCSKYCERQRPVNYTPMLSMVISAAALLVSCGFGRLGTGVLAVSFAVALGMYLKSKCRGDLKRTLDILHSVRSEILKREGWQIVADDERPSLSDFQPEEPLAKASFGSKTGWCVYWLR